jgi:hypothetical protein
MRVLVLGGYGVFGSRAVERLARPSPGNETAPRLDIIIAGRDKRAAEAEAVRHQGRTASRIEAARLDTATLSAADLKALDVQIVLNTAGPFQGQDHRVARASIEAGAHYVDLADARAFVAGIRELDRDATDAGILVASGASSVPALACAVIEHLAPDVGALRSLIYGITPGNSFDPGLATVEAILGGLGQPFMALIDGRRQVVHGWQPLRREAIDGLGTRWFGSCDVPDLDLFPPRFPTLRTQKFVAGVEVKLFQAALWALSWAARAGVTPRPVRLARPLLGIKRRLMFLGSDRGGMFLCLEGEAPDGTPMTRRWELVAGSGHGPYIPAIPAVLIVRALAGGRLRTRGAMPALGLMTLADFSAEVADLDIRQRTT